MLIVSGQIRSCRTMGLVGSLSSVLSLTVTRLSHLAGEDEEEEQ